MPNLAKREAGMRPCEARDQLSLPVSKDPKGGVGECQLPT